MKLTKYFSYFLIVVFIIYFFTASIKFNTEQFDGEINITIHKLAGAYAEYCADCASDIMSKAIISYGEKRTTKLVPKDGSLHRGFFKSTKE